MQFYHTYKEKCFYIEIKILMSETELDTLNSVW